MGTTRATGSGAATAATIAASAVAAIALLAGALAARAETPADGSLPGDWTAAERALIGSMSLDSLPPPPASPGNPVADDPRAATLGHRLFFDERLGAGGVSCASCHDPGLGFADARARGRGHGETPRRTMSLVGAAWSPWFGWDGRHDSLWAQALEPLESPVEHGGTRLRYLHLIANDPDYRAAWEPLFGPLPDAEALAALPASAGPRGTPEERAAWEALDAGTRSLVSGQFANVGRALEAYQRRIVPAPGSFDRFARAVTGVGAGGADAGVDVDIDALSTEQRLGLRLFIDRANCVHCHNGPLFTNNEFHATGIFPHDRLPEDRGRIEGVKRLVDDEFNCLGPHAGTQREDCGELEFVKASGVELVGAFRTPTLRGVAERGPYMHDGRFATLREVLEHYDEARPTLISDELEPLGLDETEFRALEAFLHALGGGLAAPEPLLSPPR